jgi:diketogulonate reductase-like aldo/keto reductase
MQQGGCMMETVTLSNGIKMPILGFGVYQIPDLAECERVVSEAIEVGYRSIDTAQAYGNEEAVGNAVRKSGLPRDEFFITTKVWISNAGYEKAKASIDESLQKLQSDYIDLVLIHQPFNDYYGTYRAMEEYYKKGIIKAIGVSNFYPDRFIDIAKFSEITPMVNQVETHVFNQQKQAQKIMEKYGTQIESWGPFAEGRNDFFMNETLKEIGVQYGKSVAQVALRYLIQRNVVVIPKTVRKERMIENFDVFNFELTNEDMDKIAKLDQEQSLFFSHYDPETVEFITEYRIGK